MLRCDLNQFDGSTIVTHAQPSRIVSVVALARQGHCLQLHHLLLGYRLDCLSLIRKHVNLLTTHDAPFVSSSEMTLIEEVVESVGELDAHRGCAVNVRGLFFCGVL